MPTRRTCSRGRAGFIHRDNRPSIRVAEKLGERAWGETRIKDMDVVVHRLERPDWTGRGR